MEGLRVDAHHPQVAEYGDMRARAEWPAWARSRSKGSPRGPASPMLRHEGGNHVCQLSRPSGVSFDKPSSLINPRSWL